MPTTMDNKKNMSLNEEKKKLVQDHIYLVKRIASKIAMFLPRHIDVDDLVNEGIMGLLDAAARFNANCGMNFSSYATIRVKGAILDSLRAMDWIPRRVRKMAKMIESTREELMQQYKRAPTPQELAEKLDMPVPKLDKVMSAVEQSQMLSFEDLQIFSNRYYIPEDKTHPIKPEGAFDDYELVDIKSVLKTAILELSDREKLVLSLYYIEDLTLKEIKEVLNISEARISQIHTLALKKLKKELEDWKEGSKQKDS